MKLRHLLSHSLFSITTILLFTTKAISAEWVASRKITDIGCHNTDNICYVSLNGSLFGASLGCASVPANGISEFRFDNGGTSEGKRAYASLLAAALSNRTVSVYLEGCTVQGMPKLVYFHVITP